MLGRGGTSANLNLTYLHPRSHLERYYHNVSPAKARELIGAIERVLAEREPLTVLLARDRVQRERRGGWQVRLENVLRRLSRDEEVPLHTQNLDWESELKLRSWQFLCAMRLFDDENHRWPTKLAELAPNYLRSVPLDPYTQLPLQYSAENGRYKLYSVGPNGRDDGGQGDDIDLSYAEFQP
jgi:hypothetical protein